MQVVDLKTSQQRIQKMVLKKVTVIFEKSISDFMEISCRNSVLNRQT
jgi:hypothetical protein